MGISKATINDVEGIRSLILRAVEPESNEDFNSNGAKNFRETLKLNAIADRILNTEYLMLCIIKDEIVAGIIAMYKGEKLSQRFVDPNARKLNIAKQLWSAAHEVCTAQGGNGNYWVKSSTMAVPVYESFGFCLEGDQKNQNGIVYYLMVLKPQS